MTSKLQEKLDERTHAVIEEARKHPLFRLAAAKQVDSQTVRAALRNVILRVHLYGPYLTRSIFHAIGRIATSNLDAAKQLIQLECEEVPHPNLAFRDYLQLGGNPKYQDDMTVSPAAFAVAATAEMLARHENPFAILGFLYLLESTTPVFIEGIVPKVEAKDRDAFTEFFSIHRTQDVEHAATLRELINKYGKKDPTISRAIAFGLECFAVVYPLPVWSEAFDQTKRETT